MLREKLFAGAFVLIYVAIVASVICRKPHGAPPERGGPETITFWQAGSGEERVQVIKRLIADFEKENPDIHVKLKIIPWGQKPHEKIQIAIASRTEPDIASVGSPFDKIIADFGVLEPLDSLLDKSTIEDFYTVTRFQDGVASVPWFTDVRALIYRKDYLRQAGVPEPRESWTWDQFVSYAKRLTKDTNGDGIVDVYGYATTARYAYQFVVFIWQNGGSLYSPDGTRATVASENSVEAVQFFVDLMKKHKVSPVFTTESLLIVRKMFAEGKVAMFMDCSDAVKAFLREPDLAPKVGVGQIPHNKEYAAYSNYDALVIFRRSVHKKAAAKFLSFLVRPDNMLLYAKVTGFSPSRRSVANNRYFQRDSLRAAFIKQAAVGRPWWMPPFTPTPSKILTRHVQMAIEGKLSVREALERAQAAMNREIGSLY